MLTFNINPSISAIGDEVIPEWGFYVYMAGDNTLYEEVDDDLNEMKMVGSNENLEIVALTDQAFNDDSHAYHIVKHGFEETPLNLINSTWNDELDMGNGDTLRDFMIWATSEYPAKNKILIIWNHGSGWEKVAEDGSSFLTVPEIRVALEEYRQETGDSKLTMVGFDACLMGMFEIAYELKEQADMVHGSEAYEPLEGWTYNNLLYKLKKNLTNYELATHVVNDYIESYRNGSVYTSYSVTAAVVDTAKLQNIWNKLENFSSELNTILPVYKDEITTAREITQRYDQNPNYRDLHDLATNIRHEIPMADVKEFAKNLELAIDEAVIAEDHWQKPEKRAVDRAHGLTIYFPEEGPKEGYNHLLIKNNSWFRFINEYNVGMESSGKFESLNITSVDTGTGYNDSVLINGTYSGIVESAKIRLLNSEGFVVDKLNAEVSGGEITEIYLQPDKSGNYSLEIGIYEPEGYLIDHLVEKNLFINLQLPDLFAEKPRVLIKDGGYHEVEHIQFGDNFSLNGDIKNIGTIASTNITATVYYGGTETEFFYDSIPAGGSVDWEIADFEPSVGPNEIAVHLISEDPFEIDSDNNVTQTSFEVFETKPHEYIVKMENINVLEIQNINGEYSFPWLESFLVIQNNQIQSWDRITVNADIIEGWLFESEEIWHISEESRALVKIRPGINTESGDYRIKIELTDRNGLYAGEGILTVNVPQYYGVGLKAEKSGGEINIVVTNNGNGKDTFKLEKTLEEGFTMLLTESYFKLDAFEEITVKGVGLESNESREYEIQLNVRSVGNENISAEVNLIVKVNNESSEEKNRLMTVIFGLGGVLLVTYIIRQRQIQ